MKRILLIFPLMLSLLVACAATKPAPIQTGFTPTPSTTEVFIRPTNQSSAAPTDAIPGRKLPAPSFESQTYIDGKAGFALDYPNSWTLTEAIVGERGSQVQFLSSPDLANAATLPEGASRLSATVYDWDPKNDLAAYVANWKIAWSASGFTILEEEQLTLEQGLAAEQFTLQTPDAKTVYLITTLGDRYLVLSGEGDLELVKEIVQRVRPISR